MRFATRERRPSADELVVEWPDVGLERLRPDHGTAVVVLTHDPTFDVPALEAALRTEAFLRRCDRLAPHAGGLGAKRSSQ